MRMLIFQQLNAEKGIPYSRVHIQRLEDAGKFPKRVKLGDGPRSRCAWSEQEIDAWLAEKMAARVAPEAA